MADAFAPLALESVGNAIVVPLESGEVRVIRPGGATERLTLAFGEPVLLQDGPAIIVEAVAGTPRIVVVQLK
jgi:hypothetical protein